METEAPGHNCYDASITLKKDNVAIFSGKLSNDNACQLEYTDTTYLVNKAIFTYNAELSHPYKTEQVTFQYIEHVFKVEMFKFVQPKADEADQLD